MTRFATTSAVSNGTYNMRDDTRIECVVSAEMKRKMGLATPQLTSSFGAIARRFGPFLSRGVPMFEKNTKVKLNGVTFPTNAQIWVPESSDVKQLNEGLKLYYERLRDRPR